MRYRITAPVARYRGSLAGLIFRDGVAEADSVVDRVALDYCRRRGYTVEPLDDVDDNADVVDNGHGAPGGVPASAERPKDYAPKPEWVAYAVSQGADPDDAENATKAELVELYGK